MADELAPLREFALRIQQVQALSGPATAQALLRVAALSFLESSLDRIHNKGIASDGSPIGEYTTSYLFRREKKGYSADKRVVLEFTGQMRRDYTILPVQGGWGTGYQNQLNADKARWNQDRYEKRIFSPTTAEIDKMRDALTFTIGLYLRTGRLE